MLFLEKYPHIFKIKAKDSEIISFKQNIIQQKIQDKIKTDLNTKGKSRLIIVKGRQGGVTTYFQLLGLSYAMSAKAYNCYTMAHDAVTASDIFDQKIKFAWDNIPPNLKNLYKLKRDNVRQLMFDEEMQKSTITVGTSARGSTQNFLHISEAGKMSENKKVWDEMISGTLQASKQAKIIAIESTADGGLGPFYEMVQKALSGQSEYDVIFLSWADTYEYQTPVPKDNSWKQKYSDLARAYNLYIDPMNQFNITEEQWYWYYLTANELGEEIKVQYPFTLEEAFVSKSRNKFDINVVKNIVVKQPLQIIDGVKIYREPELDQIYCIGIDPSSGLGSDWTGLTMRKYYRNTGGQHELVAQLKGKVSERETARIAVNLANYFNSKRSKTLIIPETNGLGVAVYNELSDNYPDEYIYKRYIQDPTKQYDTLIPDYGWKTTAITRPKMVNDMAYMFADGQLEIKNEDEVQEMRAFIYNDEKKRYQAQEGANDDLLFSDMICIQGFQYVTQYL